MFLSQTKEIFKKMNHVHPIGKNQGLVEDLGAEVSEATHQLSTDKDFGNPPPDHSNASIFQRIHEDKNFGNPLPNTFGKFDASTYYMYMYPYDD